MIAQGPLGSFRASSPPGLGRPLGLLAVTLADGAEVGQPFLAATGGTRQDRVALVPEREAAVNGLFIADG